MEEVEELLVTDFYLWEHSSGAHKDIACDEYHVPAHIQEHIDYVTPGIRMRANGVRKRDFKAKAAIHWPATHPNANNTISKLNIIGNGSYPGVNSTSCSTYITADCIRGMSYSIPPRPSRVRPLTRLCTVQYGVPNGTTAAAGNELGIFENLNDHYSTADLDTYLATVYP